MEKAFNEYIVTTPSQNFSAESLSKYFLGKEKRKVSKITLYNYLENIVYNELLSRRYDVKVGNLEKAEIDFIATRFSEKIYIQVAYILTDEDVVAREFDAYDGVTRSFNG